VVQPKEPLPEAAAPPLPPPPPPPVPQPPPQPHPVIRPDDVIAPGARPDGQSQASRGGTQEPFKAGGLAGEGGGQAGKTPPQPPAPQRVENNTPPAPTPAPQQVASNANSNAKPLPNLARAADRIADQTIRAQQRGGSGEGSGAFKSGAKTGRADAPNGQNFSAEPGARII